MARDPLDAYGGLARRYGDAIRLPYGRNRAVYLLSRPEHAERVLVANQDNYVKAFTYRPLRALLGDGLLTSEGETWRRHRRLVQPVFAHRHVTGFGPQIAAVAERHAGRWPDGVRLDVAAAMRRLTLDVVGRALFGSELAGDAERTGDALARLQRGSMAGVAGAFLPEATMRKVLRRAPGPAGAVTTLEGMVRRVIEERRASAGERPADLLELLLASGLSDAEVGEEVLTLMLAGHETTAASLAWTFVLLSRYPAARERLEAEVDEAGLDADRLPWTRAVLSEAMRLYPPAWTIERDALADDDVAGVRVPAGSTVGVPPYLLHRHPEFWPNPEGFDPERFMGESSGRPRHAYLPFGGGRRICVGAGFAMLEGVLLLAAISRTHRLDLAPGVAVPARAEITLRPDGPVPMRVSRRSASEAPG